MKKPVTLNLPVKLTDEELLERADQLCEAEQRTTELHDEMERTKTAASEKKKAIDKALDGQRGIRARLSRQIRSRTERRQVECELLFVHDQLKVVTQRLDTEEVVDVRDMTPEEQQLILGEEPVKLSQQLKKMIEQFEKQMADEPPEGDEGDDEATADAPGDPGR